MPEPARTGHTNWRWSCSSTCCSCSSSCSCFGVCHANSNGMLNVYLRGGSSSKGRSSGWAWHWPQLFCRFLHIANDAKDTAQCCQATVATLLLLSPATSLFHSFSLSLLPFPTPGNRNLVKGNISCCFLPAFFFVPHAFLKVDCIRRRTASTWNAARH